MKKNIYHAKSLKSAEREVRMLRKQRAQVHDLLDRLVHENKLLAKLSSDQAQFFNPFDILAAKQVRDRILGAMK